MAETIEGQAAGAAHSENRNRDMKVGRMNYYDIWVAAALGHGIFECCHMNVKKRLNSNNPSLTIPESECYGFRKASKNS